MPLGSKDLVRAAEVRTWRSACETLARFTYAEPDYEVTVTVDWRPGYAVVKRGRRIASACARDRSFEPYKRQPTGWNIVEMECSAAISRALTPRAAEVPNTGTYHLEQFVYDSFLGMNLAAPGAANFESLSIHSSGRVSEGPRLNSDLLEYAWSRSTQDGWPDIREIRLSRVWDWLVAQRIGVRQRAASPMERALFAVLHVCRRGRDDPSTLIWLAHALEALYGTPKDAIIEALRRRVCDLLEVPDDRIKSIRKNITRFYEARSAFVHGTFPVSHPHENEEFDSSINDYRSLLIDLTDFAMAVVVSTIQLHIRKSWQQVVFHETARGVPV
jgi:hypothetical protein